MRNKHIFTFHSFRHDLHDFLPEQEQGLREASIRFEQVGLKPKINKDLLLNHLLFLRTLPGTLPSGVSNGFGMSTMSVVSSIHRHFSTKIILICSFLAMFEIVMALVLLSGYLVSCDELAYETRRQVYGRSTLGKH